MGLLVFGGGGRGRGRGIARGADEEVLDVVVCATEAEESVWREEGLVCGLWELRNCNGKWELVQLRWDW